MKTRHLRDATLAYLRTTLPSFPLLPPITALRANIMQDELHIKICSSFSSMILQAFAVEILGDKFQDHEVKFGKIHPTSSNQVPTLISSQT